MNGVNPDLKTPYTQQWNLTLERQVSSMGLRASYVGSRSVNLVYRRNLNLPIQARRHLPRSGDQINDSTR